MRAGTTERLFTIIAFIFSSPAFSEPPPVSAFARAPALRDVSVSPDGRYIAYVSESDAEMGDAHTVMVVDRASGAAKEVLRTDAKHSFDFKDCNWAHATRLICRTRSFDRARFGPGRDLAYETSKIIAVNADGSGSATLTHAGTDAQRQDDIFALTPNDPDTVLIALDDDGNGVPGIYQMNVNDGRLKMLEKEKVPFRRYWSNGDTRARLAHAVQGRRSEFHVRLLADPLWKPLNSFTSFAKIESSYVYGFTPGTNRMLVSAPENAPVNLLEVDLASKDAPKTIFSHPQGIYSVFRAPSGKPIGVRVGSARHPEVYFDPPAKSAMDAADALLPGASNRIDWLSDDEKLYIVGSVSETDPGSFYIFDAAAPQNGLKLIGRAYPELPGNVLGKMTFVDLAIGGGRTINAVLTEPQDKSPNTPLLIVPNGEPPYEFGKLRSFLTSRGYAVLQVRVNRENQDWGGVPYATIVEVARAAVAKDFVKPGRIAILGEQYGGYLALLGAVRNPELFKCAVSINGFSDLEALSHTSGAFVGGGLQRAQIGSDLDKLRADSPREHASKLTIPVLLIHAEHDWRVPVEQSMLMAEALQKAGKPHEFLKIAGADAEFSWRSDSAALLTAIEKYLSQCQWIQGHQPG